MLGILISTGVTVEELNYIKPDDMIVKAIESMACVLGQAITSAVPYLPMREAVKALMMISTTPIANT